MNLRLSLYLVQGGRCFYCTRELRFRPGRRGDRPPRLGITLDHVIPRKLGGEPNGVRVIACHGCNAAKGHSWPDAELRRRAAAVYDNALALFRRFQEDDLSVRLRVRIER